MAKVRIKKFTESQQRTYWVSETGNFYSISKATKERKILKAVYCQNIKAYKINAAVLDGHGRRSYVCKQVVAKEFHPDWEEHCMVEHIDGDASNCRVDNLRCIPTSEYRGKSGRTSGRKNKYLYGIYDGDERIFVGMNRECSDFLGISYNRINSYYNNNTKVKGKYIVKIEGEII